MLTDRERQVLDLIRRDPMVSQQTIADALGISRSAAAGHVMHLSEKGVIRGRGYLLEDEPAVWVYGGANVDLEGRAALPLLGGDSTPGTVTRSPGGVARNVAENLARLGVPTRLVTAFGDDPDGRWLHEQTASAGVDLSAALWVRDGRTSTYLSILDADGQLAQGLNDMEVIDRIRPDDIPTPIGAPAVMVDANLSPDALARVFAQTTGTPVFADPVSMAKAERLRPYLAQIHTLKPNLAEAGALARVPVDDAAGPERAAGALVAAGVRNVVVSMGARGSHWATVDGHGLIHASPARTSASVTGAGDALLAGLMWSHMEGLSLDDGVRLASHLASLTVEQRSTVLPTIDVRSLGEVTA